MSQTTETDLCVVVGVDLLVGVVVGVEVDGGGGDGVGEHEHEDEDVEGGRLEESLAEGGRRAARLALVHRHHVPVVTRVTV